MMRKRFVVLSALAVLMSFFAIGSLSRASAAPAKAGDCDRTCLNGFVDQYMAAVAAHDPSKLPTTANVRYTENNVEMKLGEGLWQTSDGWGSYKVYTDDPESGQVGFLGVANEDSHLSCFAARLKVVDHKVTEIEVIVARPDGPAPAGSGALTGGPANLKDKPLFSEDEPASERVSREKLIASRRRLFLDHPAEHRQAFYHVRSRLPAHGERIHHCKQSERDESGGQDGLPGATRDGDAQNGHALPRSPLLVDEQKQMVFAATFFDHDGTVRKNTLVDGTTRTIGPPFDRPFTFLIFELFKIKDGKIRQIEAVLDVVPYYMPSPWVKAAK